MHNIAAEKVFEYPQEPLEFAQLQLGYDYLGSKGIRFEEDHDELDSYLGAYLEICTGERLMLMARHEHPNFANRVGVIVSPNNLDPVMLLDRFLDEIG